MIGVVKNAYLVYKCKIQYTNYLHSVEITRYIEESFNEKREFYNLLSQEHFHPLEFQVKIFAELVPE